MLGPTRSRRTGLRSAEKRGSTSLRANRRGGGGRRRHGAGTRRTRRQRLTARKHLDVLARERLALEQRGSNLMEQANVFLQGLFGALVRTIDHAFHFGIDELRGLLRDL